MKLQGKSILSAAFVFGATLAVAGCAALGGNGPAPSQASNGGTSIGNANYKSKMASSIFLQPVAPAKRLVYVEGHNTSSAQNLKLSAYVEQKLTNSGYMVTNDPTKAEYMLMYNVRYFGKETKSKTAAGALAGGFGASLVEAASQGQNTWWWSEGAQQTARAGILGAVAGGIIGHFLSKNYYMMVVDIQVEQRDKEARSSSFSSSNQGLSSTTYSSSNSSGWKIYRDRVVSQAGGRRLKFSYAEPALEKVMAGEIAGIF